VVRLLRGPAGRDSRDRALRVRDTRGGGPAVRIAERERQLERHDEGADRQARRHCPELSVGDGGTREGRGLHGALLRPGRADDHDAEVEDVDIALQVPHRAGERSLALHSGGLLLHQLPHVVL